jgi:hypothetical protein
MNTFKCWQQTYNAAITGLTSQPQNPQAEQKQVAEAIAAQAKLIADRAVQYHIQFAGTVNESLQSNLAPQLHNQESKPYPYKSTR